MSDELKCPFCGRNNFKSNAGLILHIKTCKQNPNKIDSPNKGRKASIEVRQKQSESHKRYYENPEARKKTGESTKLALSKPEIKDKLSKIQKIIQNRPEAKQKQREIQKIVQNKPEVKQKRSIANSKRWESAEARQKQSETQKIAQNKPEVKIHRKIIANSPEIKQKRYNTLKKNNTFNTSKIERELKNYFDSNNILYITQYKNNLYPFCCDFYFPDKDLYVEIQGCWTHGGKPYISTDETCIEQLELWKSKNTDFYNNAIDTWTVRDVKKRETAKTNNLNYIEIFSTELKICIDIITNKLNE